MDDTLYDLEKDYFLGSYQSCINKANSMKSTKESLFYMCLSYSKLKKYDILNLEVSKSDDQCVKLVQTLTDFLENDDNRQDTFEFIKGMLEDKSIDPKDEHSRLIISSIFVHMKDYASALEVLHNLDSLPVMFTRIGVYIYMNRFDLAERQLKVMQNKDDYATLTLLAAAKVKLVTNKAKEAHDIAQELEDKYRATPLLKNLQAAAAICMGNFELAKEHCESSLEMDNDNLEALINVMHVVSNTRSCNEKKEIRERYFNRLKTLYPNHEVVREIQCISVDLA